MPVAKTYRSVCQLDDCLTNVGKKLGTIHFCEFLECLMQEAFLRIRGQVANTDRAIPGFCTPTKSTFCPSFPVRYQQSNLFQTLKQKTYRFFDRTRVSASVTAIRRFLSS